MAELVPRIGALLVGRNTWGGDDPNRGTDREGPFGGTWSGLQYVLAHDPPADGADVFFRDDLERAIAEAREAAGVLMCVAPVMLGDGVRMLACPGGTDVSLERISGAARTGRDQPLVPGPRPLAAEAVAASPRDGARHHAYLTVILSNR